MDFVSNEVTILEDKGYYIVGSIAAGCSSTVAACCNGANTVVAQPNRALAWDYDNDERDNKIESLGGDLNPRPLPYQGNALPG